ncbi:MAG: DMT family transporter [Bacteroidaceae bacterium]|nr:DMT family transporter [Bacteroidaceae bacterium]
MNSKLKGYLWGAIGGATYGMNPLFTLPLYQEGMSPDSVLFFRYLFAIPILALMMKFTHVDFKITFREIPPLVFMGIMFALCSLTLFQSYNYMDAGIASTILFLYPILVALIMTFIFKEKLSPVTIFCLLMATAGIGLLYKGEDGATLSLVGTILVIISALTYAIYIVGINRTRLKKMNTIKVTFYVLLFGWSLFAVRSMIDGGVQSSPADKWFLWGNLLALGLLPTAISLLTTTIAIQHIGSTPTAILGALEPATAIFFGITVFNETLTFRETCGLILIIIAVCIVVIARDKKPA